MSAARTTYEVYRLSRDGEEIKNVEWVSESFTVSKVADTPPIVTLEWQVSGEAPCVITGWNYSTRLPSSIVIHGYEHEYVIDLRPAGIAP